MAFKPTLRRMAQVSPAYQSPYGPKYTVSAHWHGLNLIKANRYGTTAAYLGIAAGVGALFFFGEVPRVRKDIFMKLPWLDTYFDRTVAPEDNPF